MENATSITRQGIIQVMTHSNWSIVTVPCSGVVSLLRIIYVPNPNYFDSRGTSQTLRSLIYADESFQGITVIRILMGAIVLLVCQHKSAQTFLLRITHLRMVVTTVATALMAMLSVMMARNVTVQYATVHI